MNQLRKLAGMIWVFLGPLAIWYLIHLAAREIAKNPVMDTRIQWTVFIGIFIPIALGMVIFGYYAIKGEYDE
jgi:hypothetical protein